ncbi:hypothetical protein [Rhizobium tibeticum]|nr:hypothetical protein [Rhizobium tibeticum]
MKELKGKTPSVGGFSLGSVAFRPAFAPIGEVLLSAGQIALLSFGS